jgi:hypothetical protein
MPQRVMNDEAADSGPVPPSVGDMDPLSTGANNRSIHVCMSAERITKISDKQAKTPHGRNRKRRSERCGGLNGDDGTCTPRLEVFDSAGAGPSRPRQTTAARGRLLGFPLAFETSVLYAPLFKLPNSLRYLECHLTIQASADGGG